MLYWRRMCCVLASWVCLLPAAAMAFGPLDVNNSYDFVILTDASLATEAQRLNAHRGQTLRSCLVTTSEVSAAFTGSTMAEKIRAFVLYAYQHWKIAPTYLVLIGDADRTNAAYDLVPTMNRYNDDISPNWSGDFFYADDGYFVGPVAAGEKKPILLIGRIPARTPAELGCAIDKIIGYDAITGTPTWLQSILMAAGDHYNLWPGDNDEYRTMNEDVRADEFSEWDPAKLQTLYSSEHHYQGDGPTYLRNAWNTGIGFVNAFGQTEGAHSDVLVGMASFNVPPTPPPTFTYTLAPTGYCPVVFGATCLVNEFHEDRVSSIAEDLLFKASDRGAVAVVAPSHVIDARAGCAMDRVFVHGMLHDGVRGIGRLLTGAQERLREFGLADAVVEQFVIIGDPATEVKLSPLPPPTDLGTGFEIEDAFALQDHRLEDQHVQNTSTRIVHVEEEVAPLGERMLRAKATVSSGCSVTLVEWGLQDVGFEIAPNAILSFWINVTESPGNLDHIVLEGNTTDGEISDKPLIVDQNGVRLVAYGRNALPAGWQFVYSDLSSLAGETLLDLRLVYWDFSGLGGPLTAYVDDVRVKRYEVPERGEPDAILNSSFEEDVDGNGTPDFWTNTLGLAETGTVTRSDHVAWSGRYSMEVDDEYGQGEGAQYLMFANRDESEYVCEFRYMSPYATQFRVEFYDIGSGNVISERVIEAGYDWRVGVAGFSNPHHGSYTARVKLRILPLTESEPVYIDDLHVYPGVLAATREVAGPDGQSPSYGLLRVVPNPGNVRCGVEVRYGIGRAAEKIVLDAFDASGRHVGGSSVMSVPAGIHSMVWKPASGSTLPPGQYFLKVRADGEPVPGSLKVMLLP